MRADWEALGHPSNRACGRKYRRKALLDSQSERGQDSVQNMGLQGYRLHPLKGERAGFWSVTVSGNWRIIFRFENGSAYDVDLVDYH